MDVIDDFVVYFFALEHEATICLTKYHFCVVFFVGREAFFRCNFYCKESEDCRENNLIYYLC